MVTIHRSGSGAGSPGRLQPPLLSSFCFQLRSTRVVALNLAGYARAGTSGRTAADTELSRAHTRSRIPSTLHGGHPPR
ncbi:hypothetical protein OAN61_00535 [bacterium]|nr:hypothetical protein [bacterium]